LRAAKLGYEKTLRRHDIFTPAGKARLKRATEEWERAKRWYLKQKKSKEGCPCPKK
jgi:hypothetical protein